MSYDEFYNWYHNVFMIQLQNHCQKTFRVESDASCYFTRKVEEARVFLTRCCTNFDWDENKKILEKWLALGLPYLLGFTKEEQDERE